MNGIGIIGIYKYQIGTIVVKTYNHRPYILVYAYNAIWKITEYIIVVFTGNLLIILKHMVPCDCEILCHITLIIIVYIYYESLNLLKGKIMNHRQKAVKSLKKQAIRMVKYS